jgi:hypothetical protein
MILSHKPIYERIASYLDPITYYNLRVASPKHASLHPTLYAFVTIRIFRELARYFDSEAIAEIIMRHVNAPNSPYVITGSFLLKVLRGDTWECNDVDIAVVSQKLSAIPYNDGFKNAESMMQDLYDNDLLEREEYGRMITAPASEQEYERRTLKNCFTFYCGGGKKLQLLVYECRASLIAHIKTYDLSIVRNAYGANNLIGIKNVKGICDAYVVLDINEAYFWRDNPKNHKASLYLSSYVKDTYAPKKHERLKKYVNRGFQITVINDSKHYQHNTAWLQWKAYWDEEGREFHQ